MTKWTKRDTELHRTAWEKVHQLTDEINQLCRRRSRHHRILARLIKKYSCRRRPGCTRGRGHIGAHN